MADPVVSYAAMRLVHPANQRRSEDWCRAFAEGAGGVIERHCRLHPGPVAMFGRQGRLAGLLRQAIGEGRDWYFGDHGYFERATHFRITRNGLQWRRGAGPGPDHDRMRALGVQIAPWRSGGGHIVICPPAMEFAQQEGFSARQWLASIHRRLTSVTDRPIFVRTRERAAEVPLSVDLHDAWCLVTCQSNASVEAIVAGVPAFVTMDCAAVPMAGTDLSQVEHPAMPDGREDWAAALCANQWTLDEILDGSAWRALSDGGDGLR